MKKRSVVVVLAMLLTASSLVFAQKDKTEPFKVYVFTAEAKYVDAESKARTDSVKDLCRVLGYKKKTVVLVEDRKSAEMTLEVLGRDIVPTGNMTTAWDPVLGETKTTQDTGSTLWVKMTVGDYSTRIIGHGPGLVAAYRVAAGEISEKIDRWIKDNGAKVDRK
jgi:hypothetical protein